MFIVNNIHAQASSIVNMSSSSSSTLSNSDRNFIEFTRCLYKAKSVVQELQTFSTAVGPTLSNSSGQFEYEVDFTSRVKQYLDDSFCKFNHMCKILLLVLSRLESGQTVRRERIDSFRQELVEEWRKASIIKQDLLKLIQCSRTIPTDKTFTDDTPYDSVTTSSETTTPEPASDS